MATTNATTTNDATPVETAPVVTHAARKKAAPARDLDVLHGASIRSMSDAEKTKYIEYLREEVCLLQNQKASLEQTCKGVFEEARSLNQKAELLRNEARAKLNFAKDAAKVLYHSIALCGDLEEK